MTQFNFIFINNSSGELDWIVPYINSSENTDAEFKVIFNFALDRKARGKIFQKYFNENSRGVEYLEVIRYPIFVAYTDRLIDGLLRRVGSVDYDCFVSLRRFFDALRSIVGKFLRRRTGLPPNLASHRVLIFRDYNLKDSFALCALESLIPHARIVVFPHSTAIQADNPQTPKNPPKRVRCDLFLENTSLSTHFLTHYKRQFKAVGVPLFDSFSSDQGFLSCDDEKRLAGERKVLFLTRNCDPRFFGFEFENALKVFEEACLWASLHNCDLIVKHHPRDSQLERWRSVQAKYNHVEEISQSLNELAPEFRIVLTFYTSAGLLFSARGIPVFDVTPYTIDTSGLPFHYTGEAGQVTHDLIEYGFYKKSNISSLPTSAEEIMLIGRQQRAAVQEHFPAATNRKIDEACRQLFEGERRA